MVFCGGTEVYAWSDFLSEYDNHSDNKISFTIYGHVFMNICV